MTVASVALAIAQAILAVHMLAALFIIAGVILIPAGMTRHWAFIDIIWWRAVHVGALGIVAGQRLLGQTCFLSVWEEHFRNIARHGPYAMPLVHAIGYKLVHWPLPFPFTTMLYTGALLYVLVLWWIRPPRAHIAAA
jgi:hypothetical protein